MNVDITNTGPSQTGQIIVPILTSVGAPKLLANYATTVELPSNSRKRYTLYVPSTSFSDIYLRLPRGVQKRKLEARTEVGTDDFLVVVVGGDPGHMKHLTGTRLSSVHFRAGRSLDLEGELQVGNTAWDELPDSWLGWDGVDAVMLGDAGFAAAASTQIKALLTWVQLGGSVIVPGGTFAPAMADGPFAEMLPIAVTGTATVPHLGELDAWGDSPLTRQRALVAAGKLQADATLWCGSEKRPLIAMRKAGAGRVVMTSFDYGAAPVRHWDGQFALWTRLLARAEATSSLTEDTESKRDPYDYGRTTLQQAAGYTPEARLPSIWLIVGFLFAYLIVLAPLQYAVLKRMDRRELAWIITPLIAILFSVAAYQVGFAIRGGQIIVNRLAIIETQPATRFAGARGYVGIFSPTRTEYELLLGDTAASGRELSRGGEKLFGTPTVHYGNPTRITDVDINMWTTRVFCAEFVADLKGGITGTCEYDGTYLRARVKNETALDLRDCRLIAHLREGPVNDLTPGHEDAFNCNPTGTKRIQQYGSYTRGSQTGAKWQTEDIAVSALFGERHYSGSVPGLEGLFADRFAPCFVAIADTPLVPVTLARQRPSFNDRALIVVRLPVHLTSGKRVTVPSFLIPMRIISTSGATSISVEEYQSTASMTVSRGHAVIEFRVPLGKNGGTARKLKLRIGLSASSYPSGPPPPPGPGMPAPGMPAPSVASTTGAQSTTSFWAHNFTTDKWEQLGDVTKTSQLPHPAEFMGEDGRVLFKIQVEGAGETFIVPSLEAEVEAD